MRTASPSPGGSAGETRRCLPVSDTGGARRGRPRCYFCYCSSFYHSVLRVAPSPSRRSPLVTQSPDVRAHLRLPTCPGVTLFSSLNVFGFGGTERRKSAPLCYQRLCNRGGRTSFLGATGTLTDPAAELRKPVGKGTSGRADSVTVAVPSGCPDRAPPWSGAGGRETGLWRNLIQAPGRRLLRPVASRNT